jgi:hemoglobin
MDSQQSLYEQLGGAEAIEAVIAGFYERMLRDPEILPFFRGVQMSRQHRQQVAFFTQALGGPAIYQGRDMVTAHKGMGVRAHHFDRLVKYLTETLHEAEVPEPLIEQLLALLGPLRTQVIEPEVPVGETLGGFVDGNKLESTL